MSWRSSQFKSYIITIYNYLYISRYHPNLIDLRIRAPHVFGHHEFQAISCFVQLQLGESIQQSLGGVTCVTSDWENGKNPTEHLYLILLAAIHKHKRYPQKQKTIIEVYRFKPFQILTLGLKLNPRLAPFICVIYIASFGKNLVTRSHTYCLRWGPIRN